MVLLMETQTEKKILKNISSVGGKLIDYHITRGQYDFVMITEAESFDKYGIACALKAC